MTTDTSLVTGVDFHMLATEDFSASVTFYRDVLGLEQSKQWGDMPGQEFETGNLTLAIVETKAFGMPFAPNPTPLALQVGDVPAARAQLEAKGVEFAADTIDSGVCHMAVFHDPAGNALMLHHRYAPKA